QVAVDVADDRLHAGLSRVVRRAKARPAPSPPAARGPKSLTGRYLASLPGVTKRCQGPRPRRRPPARGPPQGFVPGLNSGAPRGTPPRPRHQGVCKVMKKVE